MFNLEGEKNLQKDIMTIIIIIIIKYIKRCPVENGVSFFRILPEDKIRSNGFKLQGFRLNIRGK